MYLTGRWDVRLLQGRAKHGLTRISGVLLSRYLYAANGMQSYFAAFVSQGILLEKECKWDYQFVM